MKTIVVAALIISAPAFASKVRPTHDITKFFVEIVWVETAGEIRVAARSYGFSSVKPKGFGVLLKIDGEYVCRIYAAKPLHVDDSATKTLGHEIAHCALGKYHS